MRRRRSSSGLGLAEILVALGALGVIFGTVFLLFSYSLHGHRLLDARQGVQGDALKARANLENDFLQSHFDSVGVCRRTLNNQLEGSRRDVVCMLDLSNWNDPSLFDEYGLPLWDRYVVYFATSDQEQGRLIRLELTPDPSPAPGAGLPIAPLPTLVLAGIEFGPGSGLRVLNRQTILDHLETFAVTSDIATQLVSVELRNRRQDGARTGVTRPIDEAMEAVFEFDPLNTSPRL